jgi:hypothetical protein
MGKLIEREFKKAQNEILGDFHKTQREKQGLIRELKMGLGDEIRKNPGKPIIIKKTWWQKLTLFFKNIFTKF